MSAYAVVGIGVPFGALFRTETKKGCSHEIPADQEFCGKCGKKREITERLFIGGCEEYAFEGFSIFRSERPKDDEIVVICAFNESADNYLGDSPINPDGIANAERILKALLDKHKIPWNNSKFGVWPYYSY